MAYRRFPHGLLAAVLALLVAGPALRAQEKDVLRQGNTARGGANAVQVFEGKVLGVDSAKGPMTLREMRFDASKAAKEKDTSGRELVVQVPEDTKISLDHSGAKLKDLKVGTMVRVYATRRLDVTGPTDRSFQSREIGNGRDTSGVRGIGGTYDPRNAKGVTRIHLKATRIEARSADTGNRSRKD